MSKYAMEFYLANNRNNVNMLRYSGEIASSIVEVFNDVKEIKLCSSYFEFDTPLQPTQGQLSTLGKLIASKNSTLNSIKTVHPQNTNLLRKKK